jgi:hypothetical protein
VSKRIQNCLNCRPNEHFCLNCLQAILFPMVVVAANFRPSSGNKIACTDGCQARRLFAICSHQRASRVFS